MLVLENLRKIYPGPFTALDGVSLEIGPGVFGLLGPNGAGKSTLMKILAGLVEPTAGAASLDGVDILRDRAWLRARLGYLPQDFGFYPELTGEQMLRYLLELKGMQGKELRAQVDALLERVNLADARGRRVATYSGGMRQRLGLAQALAGDPRLIIVDEPTVGLDPAERARFHGFLSELAEERVVLLSTHIVEDVAILCPRFAVLQQGRLVRVATPEEARRELEGTIFEGPWAGESAVGGPRVLRRLLRAGRRIVRVHSPSAAPAGLAPVPPTLEDAFALLVSRDRDELQAPRGSR